MCTTKIYTIVRSPIVYRVTLYRCTEEDSKDISEILSKAAIISPDNEVMNTRSAFKKDALLTIRQLSSFRNNILYIRYRHS